ncbi:UNVERIFIED_CONTAM: hypothetical protein Sindi_0479000, partial [Sesamum indicum]
SDCREMTWHANNQTEEGSMCHSSDVDVWWQFDWAHPHFGVEPRNVRLVLCTDGSHCTGSAV